MENQISIVLKREKTINKTSDNSEEVHFIKHVRSNEKTFKIFECGVCGNEFKNNYLLLRHLSVHSKSRNYQCTECGKSFRLHSSLEQHKAIHSSQRPFVCDLCDKSFNRKSTLISHKKIHLQTKPYKCKFCDKSFHQKGNLKNHLFIHTNERPYLCNFCEKGFNQMSNLACHKKKFHSNENLSVASCLKKIDELRSHELKEKKPIDVVEFMIPAIKTEALTKSKENNEIPFALLHLINRNILIVRIIDCGVLSLIREVSNDDFELLKGTNSKITLPMVADIHQKIGLNGTLEYVVRPPETNYNFLKYEPIEPIKKTIAPIIIKHEEICETFELPKQLTELKNVTNQAFNLKSLNIDGIENDAWLTDGKPKVCKTGEKIVDVEGFNEDSSASSLDKNEYSLLIHALHSDGFVPDFDGIKNYFAGNDVSFNF